MMRVMDLAAALVIQVTVPTGDGQVVPGLTVADSSALRALVEGEMKRLGAPGVSIAVVRGGVVVYAGGFGQARVEERIEAAAQTLYRTASVAKPITATAVLQLVEAGRIEMDAPVQRYCRAYPEKRWPVTVRQLLSHTSGVRHASDREDEQTAYYPDTQAALRIFHMERLQHEPGTRVTYSTLGYTILACAIEGASGQSYMDYLNTKILAPAGMVNTTRDTISHTNPQRALGYRKDGRRIEPSRRVDTSFKLAGGGLVSTVVDLARFAITLQEGRYVSSETLQLMWTPVSLTNGTATPFGLGWQVTEHDGHRIVVVAGQQDEVSTVLLMVPDRNAAIVMMSNLERHAEQLTPVVGRILRLLAIT
jgi:CubicO group peptidase (beta-lactamase class C family)